MVTRYSAVEGGQFVPAIPTQCTSWAESDGSACSIRIHSRRWRKTGPGYPLVVAECREHGVAFTLYPPGYVPYSRVAVAPVDAEGQLVREVEDVGSGREGLDDEDEGKTAGQLSWDTTIFRAARDAERRLAWPRRNTKDAMGSWRTQGRWLAIAAACLGLTSGDSDHWPLVGLLGVPGLVWREARAKYADARGYVVRGQAVMLALGALYAAGHRLLDMLLAAGFKAARWGEPQYWDPRARMLRGLVRLPRPP